LGAWSIATAPSAQALSSYGEINDWPTYYEVPPFPAVQWQYDTTFYSRLEAWIRFFYVNTPYNWVTPAQICGYGAYVNKPGYHGSGRAFDLSRIYLHVDGLWERVFNGRYDEWRSLTGSALTVTRKRYFACAASIHYHFRNVLTYLYNTDHWNHIHIDNGVSGAGNSYFVTSSGAQVEFVRAALNYVWGYPVAINQSWDSTVDYYVRLALARSGGAGPLTTQSYWQRFCQTTTRFGTGKQAY